MMFKRILSIALILPALLESGSAASQAYPARPLRVIVGIAPGGGLDAGARLVAAKLSEVLGHPVMVENRAGAGGTIAADAVARAQPDGYTLLYCASSLLIAPSLYDKLAFDPVKSFAAVGGVGWEPLVVVVNLAVPARTTAELIALLKAHPGKYSYGSPGVGSVHHLAMELFRKQAGVDIVHVPYKGAAPILPDLLSGVLPMAIMSAASAAPQARAGKLRPIALTRPVKLSIAPDWPTLAEVLPGFDMAPAHFMLAPAGTPAVVIGRLSEALRTVLAAEDTRRSFLANGATAEFAAPEALAARMRSELHKWGALAKESGAKRE